MKNDRLELVWLMADWFSYTHAEMLRGEAKPEDVEFYNEFADEWYQKLADFIEEPDTFTEQDTSDVFELYHEAYVQGVL